MQSSGNHQPQKVTDYENPWYLFFWVISMIFPLLFCENTLNGLKPFSQLSFIHTEHAGSQHFQHTHFSNLPTYSVCLFFCKSSTQFSCKSSEWRNVCTSTDIPVPLLTLPLFFFIFCCWACLCCTCSTFLFCSVLIFIGFINDPSHPAQSQNHPLNFSC